MLGIALTSVLVLVGGGEAQQQDAKQQVAPAPVAAKQDAKQQADAGKELAALCQKLVEAESYTFEETTESAGGGSGRGGGGGEPPAPIVGEYMKDLPLHVTQGDTEGYREDGQLVYKVGDEEWTSVDMNEMSGRGAFGGGEGRRPRERGDEGGGERAGGGQAGEGDKPAEGDEPAEGGQAGRRPEGGERGAGRGERGERGAGRGERGQGGGRGRRALFSLGRLSLPHELLADIGTKVTDVTRSEVEGKVVYAGKLTDEGAMSLASFGRRMGSGGPDFDFSGTFEATLSEQGALDRLVFNTKMAGSFGERSFERSTKRIVLISKLNATEFVVPEEAIANFEL